MPMRGIRNCPPDHVLWTRLRPGGPEGKGRECGNLTIKKGSSSLRNEPPSLFRAAYGAAPLVELVHRLRLEGREIGLAAHRHHAHLVCAVDRDHDLELALTFVNRDVANLRAAYRQFEGRPLLRRGVVFDDLVVGPEVAPDVVLLVDRDV